MSLHNTPYIIERDREVETDNGSYDACEVFEVYITHYHNEEPSGRPLGMCETPEEAYGCEEYEYSVFDEDGNEVAIELTGKEESELLAHFYKCMED